MKIVISVLCFILAFGSMSQAKANYDAESLSHQINLAGKQRMLTQKMSKEALLIALGYDIENNVNTLVATRNLFEKTLKGLKVGDESLKLQKTRKPRILDQLSKVESVWNEFKKPINNIIAKGYASEQDIQKISELNIPLLKNMHKAVQMY